MPKRTPQAERGSAERPVAPASQPRRGSRFALLFGAYLTAGFSLLLAPFAQDTVTAITNGIASISGMAIRLVGGHATVQGDLLVGAASGHAIRVANGCNGLHVSVLLWAAVAAFPAPLKERLRGLAIGTAVVHAANLIRIVTLFFLEPKGRKWFDLAHLYLWEAMIILATFGAFWLWAQRAYGTEGRAAAATQSGSGPA